MQHNLRIQRNILHAKHHMHGIAERTFTRALRSGLPQRRLIAWVAWPPLAERETFAVNSHALVPVTLRSLFCSVLDCWAVDAA